MELSNMPRVGAKLYVSGRDFLTQKFTKDIGIIPTKVKTKEDWPEAIKKNDNLPKHLKPRCVWAYFVEEENCKDIDIAVNKITQIFISKGEEINSFRKRFEIELSLEIVIHAETMGIPFIHLKNEDIIFWGMVGADISFDIYTY